jgi:exodeoxyribonuclease VII large subunit
MTEENSRILTVGQLTQYLKELFTADPQLSRLRVSGEISNFKRHTSGHLYFTLKDASASLRCVMFRSQNTRLNFSPADGLQVVAAGRLSVYERDGQYQLYVESLLPKGVGSLYAAFAELKQRLQAEGLFAAKHKKKLPRFPRRLGLVTSLSGAVVRDFLTTVGRRYPQAEVLIVPVLVQGPEAPGQIVAAIQLLNRTPGIEAIVLARGGGSIEELWAFNEESVARAIHASAIPVVSAVGHETDFTIADFAADIRAATPTAAAELTVPDQREIQAFLLSARQRMTAALQRNLEQDRRYLERLASAAALTRPLDRLEQQKQSLDNMQTRLESRIYLLLQKFRAFLDAMNAQLAALNPNQVLERGYALCLDRTGQVVRDAAGLAPGDRLEILLQRGRAEAIVEKAYEGGCSDGSTKPLV